MCVIVEFVVLFVRVGELVMYDVYDVCVVVVCFDVLFGCDWFGFLFGFGGKEFWGILGGDCCFGCYVWFEVVCCFVVDVFVVGCWYELCGDF